MDPLYVTTKQQIIKHAFAFKTCQQAVLLRNCKNILWGCDVFLTTIIDSNKWIHTKWM